MAWNGSLGNAKSQTKPKKVRCSCRGIFVGLLVVVGGAAVCWMMAGQAKESPHKLSHRQNKASLTRIAVANQPVVTNKMKEPSPPAEPEREKTAEELRDEKIRYYERTFGDNMPEGLKAHIYYLKNPPKRVFGADDKYGYVKRHSEKQLASFLTVTPGTHFIQCPEFDESFDTDFIAAMREDIEIDPKDPHEVKEMKKAITDFKKEIADICKAEGKLPSQILNDHAMSLFELGRFQQNMQTQLDEIYNSPKYTDADVKDFCTAANMMLENNGLDPLPYPDLTERTMELQYNLRHAEEGEMDNE